MKTNNNITSRYETYATMYNTYFDKISNTPNRIPTATDIVFLYLQYKLNTNYETLHIYNRNLHDYLRHFSNLKTPAYFEKFSY